MSAARSLTCLSLVAACFLAACPGPQPNPVTLPDDSLGDTTVGVPYSHTIGASGGTGTLTYAAVGVPAGLLMDSNSGKLSGTATAAGDFNITVTVTDASNGSATRSYPFKVYPAVSLLTASFPDAVVGSPYSQPIQTDGGKAPIALTLTSSDLPSGMAINSAGALAGTPSATGTFSFTVQARDANGATATRSYTLTSIESLRIVTTTLPPGNVGVAYSQVIQATGGRAPISFSLTSGALPPGLTLAATGVISGTPTGGGGTFSFRVSAQDGGGAIVSANLSLTILGTMPPRIVTASLPDAVVGRAYNVTLQGADGAPPYAWAVTTGALPSGMSLSASGVLSGTPSGGGSFPIQVSLTDANGQVATKSLTLLVIAELQITTTSLADAYTGTVFSTTLGVTGGRTPYSWSVTSGALPAGITLSSGGILTGTPSAAGASGFVVTVTDGSGQSANQALSITVYDPPSLVNTVLADASTTSAYNELLTATGGKSPYSFAVTAGALPPGLTLSATGAITGTPTMASGTPYNFAVTVTDANGRTGSRNYSILVSAGLVVTTGTLPDGYTGSAYTVNLAAVGGRTPYTWSLASGTLPTGLTLSSAGVISGTPTVAATRTFDVRVTDATSPSPQSATKTLAIAVFAPPSITTTSLADGYVGSAYSATLAGTGGRTPYTFSVSAGALPAGLSLAASGILSGTPTTNGTASFTVQLTDANGQQATRALSITVYPALVIGTTSLPDGYRGTLYDQSLTASGGKAPLTWSVTGGTLPAGLALSSTGRLSGTPTAAAASTFTVAVSDANGQTVSQVLTLAIYDPLAVTTSALPDGYLTIAYDVRLAASGGKAPLTWALTAGTLPSGIVLGADGHLTGTPTATFTGASLTFTATDANGQTASRALSISTYALPSVTTTSLPDGVQGVVYSQTLTAAGGKAPLTWTVSAGALPAGLTLSPTGTLSGTPTVSGTFNFTVQVADANGRSDAKPLSLVLAPPLAITTASLPEGYTGSAYSATVAASGGKAPYTFTLAVGSLPAGLSLSAAGAITGTPTTAGTSTFTVRVTDANSSTATAVLSITLYAPLVLNTTSYADGYTASAYNQSTSTSGGKAPLLFSISSGALPGGVTLNPSTGALTGTPTVAGTFNFTLTVADALTMSVSRAMSISVYNPPQISTASPLADGYVGDPYSVTLASTGGKTPLTWSRTTGTLPNGLTLSSAGVIGTGITTGPTNGQVFSFTVSVADANGRTASAPLTITVYLNPTVTNASLVRATEGVTYRRAPGVSEQLTGANGKAPFTWTATGLPPGIALDSATGVLSGIPARGSAGTYNASFTLSDANAHSGSKTLAILVVVPVPIYGGGTVGVEPDGSPITDVLTVFVTDYAGRPLPNMGVRVRKNGTEYSPTKQTLTDSTGKAFFSGLGLNGTTDTVDVTGSGPDHGNHSMLKVNAAVVTLALADYQLPLPRYAASGVYDPAAGRAIITMGFPSPDYSNGVRPVQCINDVVRLDTAATDSWTEVVPPGMASSPSPRGWAAMANGGGASVMFGGSRCLDGTYLGDTWLYFAGTNTWARGGFGSGFAPSPRYQPHMTGDNTGSGVLLFGGYTTSGPSNELWSFTPATDSWTQLMPTGATPLPRYAGAAAYVPAYGEMWTCGGWVFNGTSYTEANSCVAYAPAANTWRPTTVPGAATMPVARSDFGMAFGGGVVYAFGGTSGGTDRNDLLAFQGTSWVTLTPQGSTTAPAPRIDPVVVYDQAAGQLVVFGGHSSTTDQYFGDLWTYDPVNGWVRRDTPAPSYGFTLSGNITNGAAGTNSYVTVSATGTSGFTDTRTIQLTGGTGSYVIPNVPPGDSITLVATNEDRSLTFPARLWNYLDLGVLGPVNSNLTQNIAFPTTRPTAVTASGTFTTPADWLGPPNFIRAGPQQQRSGFPMNRNGTYTASVSAKTFSIGYWTPPAPAQQNMFLVGESLWPAACEDSFAFRYNITSGALGNVALPAGARSVSPGVSACSPAGTGLGPVTELSTGTGSRPTAVATGDFNSDGLVDFAVTNSATNTVEVFLASQPGQYNNPGILLTGLTNPQRIAVADLDFPSTNTPDIVVTNAPASPTLGSVTVFKGNGAGGFTPLPAVTVGLLPVGVAIANVSGTGAPDVVVANYGSNTVQVLQNNGSGTLTALAAVPLPTGFSGPAAVALADFNGDSKMDVVSANYDSANALVMSGNGLGGFTAAWNLPCDVSPITVAIGDVNGDGNRDVVVGNEGGHDVDVYPSDATGRFTAGLEFAVGATVDAVGVADFTGDGLNDIAVATTGSIYSAVTVFRSTGSSFSAIGSQSFSFGNRSQLAVADVNGDAHPDVVVSMLLSDKAGVLLGLRPLPQVAEGTYSFTAPTDTKFIYVDRGARQLTYENDLVMPGSAGPLSFSWPLPATIAPSRPAPIGQEVGWETVIYTFGPTNPFNYNNHRRRFLQRDGQINSLEYGLIRQ